MGTSAKPGAKPKPTVEPDAPKSWQETLKNWTQVGKDIGWWGTAVAVAGVALIDFLGYNLESFQGLIFSRDQAWYYMGRVRPDGSFKLTDGWKFIKVGEVNEAEFTNSDADDPNRYIVTNHDGKVSFFVRSVVSVKDDNFFIGRALPTQASSMLNIPVLNSCFEITVIEPSPRDPRYLWGKGRTIVGNAAAELASQCDI